SALVGEWAGQELELELVGGRVVDLDQRDRALVRADRQQPGRQRHSPAQRGQRRGGRWPAPPRPGVKLPHGGGPRGARPTAGGRPGWSRLKGWGQAVRDWSPPRQEPPALPDSTAGACGAAGPSPPEGAPAGSAWAAPAVCWGAAPRGRRTGRPPPAEPPTAP